MRKLLVVVLALCATVVPAVAFAASADTDTNTTQAAPAADNNKQVKREAKRKLRTANVRADREQRAEKRKAARKRAKRAARRAAAGGPAAAGTPTAASGGASPALEAIAACESGGNPSAVGGGGAYRGKYQFSYSTWAAVGGSGDPAAAPEAEQDARAAQLYAQAGASQWPTCGQ